MNTEPLWVVGNEQRKAQVHAKERCVFIEQGRDKQSSIIKVGGKQEGQRYVL